MDSGPDATGSGPSSPQFKKDRARRTSRVTLPASAETSVGSPTNGKKSRRSSRSSRCSRRLSMASPGAATPADSISGIASSRRSLLWERTSDSVREALERVSVAQAAFEDTSRVRTITPTTLMSPHIAPLQEVGTSTAHGGKILAVVLVLIVSLLVLLYYFLRSSDTNRVTVDARWSTYRGVEDKFDGRSVFTFMGIPFGGDMSGQQRFRKPQVVTPSEDLVQDATKAAPSCNQAPLRLTVYQKEANLTSTKTSEGCLYLNVWTPSLPRFGHSLKTVLVFIYSIEFKWGSNNDYDAKPLSALGDIVVVMPNYRLHALGFLGDDTEDAPGNLALYDQLLALDWVHENIEAFGGDKSSVVLHGYESGAVSIGYHMASPTQHWVKNTSRLILQSGSPFQLYKDNTAPSSLMDILGCNRGGWSCLRGLSTEEFRAPNFYRAFDFGPDFHSKYLPEHPHKLLKTRPIANKQVLLGNVLDEGSFMAHVYSFQMQQGISVIGDPIFTAHVQKYLQAAGVARFDSVRQRYASKPVWESYQGNEAAIELLGDALFNCPVQYLAEHLVDHGSSVYKYVWTYKPTFGPWAAEEFGPTQYDDLAFVFGSPLLDFTLGTRHEQELSRRTIDIFSQFAKTGELPKVVGEAWPSYTRSNPSVVEIGAEGLALNTSYRLEQCSQLREHIIRYT